MTMNGWVGGQANTADLRGRWGPNFLVYTRLNQMVNPGPAMTFVLLDEREDSINNSYFPVDMRGYPNAATTKIANYPASYHNRAGGFSFADGHSAIKRWLDPRTIPALTAGGTLPTEVPSANNVDVVWMQDRSTREIGR
jgi:hypothetical protein